MTLPNFLHIGAPKCASSWLYRVCLDHPDIYHPAQPDNINFFTVAYHRGLPWYEQTYFADVQGEKAIGECSNSYYCFEPALQRIARDLPGVKLTMMFRDPAERVYLHWAHMVVKKRPDGKNKYGFDPDKGIGPSLERVFHHHGHGWFRMFVEPGFYDLHLERIHRYFPKENVMVMLHDDLVADPQATVRRFFSFLGVDPNHQSSLIGRTTNPDVEGSPHRPGEAFFAELRAAYADSIDRFADMIGRDLTHWKTGAM